MLYLARSDTILHHLQRDSQPISQAIYGQRASSDVHLGDSIGDHCPSQVDVYMKAGLADNMGRLQTELQLLKKAIETSSSALKQVEPSPPPAEGSLVLQNDLEDPRKRMLRS